MVRRVLTAISRATIAGAVAFFLYWSPPILLLRAIPWLPQAVDPWFLLFAVQVSLFLAIAIAFRARLASSLCGGVSAASARAVFWLLSGAVLLALLGALSIISTSEAPAVGFSVKQGMQSLTKDHPINGLAGSMLRLFVLLPVFEEFLFRVFILGFVLKPLHPAAGLAVSTALFASFHGSVVISSLGGLAFGLLYLRYGSVWVCVLAHSGANLLLATGAPMLVAHLHEVGLLSPIRQHLLPVQLVWFALVLSCFWMFIRCLRDGYFVKRL